MCYSSFVKQESFTTYIIEMTFSTSLILFLDEYVSQVEIGIDERPQKPTRLTPTIIHS